MGKHTKIQQKKLKIAEKEKTIKPKKVYKGNTYRNRNVEETEKDGNDKKDWNDNEKMDFMSVAIFGLTSNRRMNGLACWMKHVV